MHDHTQDWRSDSKAETKQQSSTGGANPRFARRRFLGAGAALMGSAVLAGYNQVADASHTSSPSDSLPNNVVPGTIERIVIPGTLYVRNSEGSKTIELSENADFTVLAQGPHQAATISSSVTKSSRRGSGLVASLLPRL